jgi:hypothetical protein
MFKKMPSQPSQHRRKFSQSGNPEANLEWGLLPAFNSRIKQGCQIFTYQIGENIPNDHKQNVPNEHKVYQMAEKYSKWS